MMTLDSLVTSLHSHAAAQLPIHVPLIVPGMVLDAETTPEWFELTCDACDGVVQRIEPAELREVTVTIQVFVRPSLDSTRIYVLAEAARRVFHTQTITILDRETTGDILGAVRFRETDVRDLTRVHAANQRPPLRHVVVTTTGRIQSFQNPDS